MPHSPAERKRVVTRLRRIRGQAEALERAVEAGTDCGELLQQLAALRGAAHGLMADVLESHLRERFDAGTNAGTARAAPAATPQAEIDRLVVLLRSFTR